MNLKIRKVAFLLMGKNIPFKVDYIFTGNADCVPEITVTYDGYSIAAVIYDEDAEVFKCIRPGDPWPSVYEDAESVVWFIKRVRNAM